MPKNNKCVYFFGGGKAEGKASMRELLGGKGFGDANEPLLVSVRSGARESMPGMMDTVLNLGLNEQTLQGLIRQTQDPRFAYDTYRRFVQMYSDVVLGVKARDKTQVNLFEQIIEQK